jgi:hypothetical protein
MPSSTHYQDRAEKLRFLMLVAQDPDAAARLRTLVEKCKNLAKCARPERSVRRPRKLLNRTTRRPKQSVG